MSIRICLDPRRCPGAGVVGDLAGRIERTVAAYAMILGSVAGEIWMTLHADHIKSQVVCFCENLHL